MLKRYLTSSSGIFGEIKNPKRMRYARLPTSQQISTNLESKSNDMPTSAPVAELVPEMIAVAWGRKSIHWV